MSDVLDAHRRLGDKPMGQWRVDAVLVMQRTAVVVHSEALLRRDGGTAAPHS